MCLKHAGSVANSVDPDQTPRSAASDQVLHCLFTLSVLILKTNTVTGLVRWEDEDYVPDV